MATPFMGLTVPVPGTGGTPGPQWAQEINSDLNRIDGHDHTPGNGVPLSISAITIDQDINMNEFGLTNIGSISFFNQPTALIGNNQIYMAAGDFYVNDGSGNQIQITAGGGLNASSIGGIGGDYVGSSASAFYTSSITTFGFTSAPGVPAFIQAGDYLLTSADGTNVVTLSNPNAGSSYTLNMPNALPGSGTSFLTVDSTGAVGDSWQLDGVTLQQVANVLSVRNGDRTHAFIANGRYVIGNQVDGLFFFPYNATITNVFFFVGTAGSGGTTTLNLSLASSPGGAFSTVLSTNCSITSAAGSNIWTDAGSVIGAQAGVTKPVLSVTNVNAGNAIRFNIINTQNGTRADCGCIIVYKQR